VAPFPGRDATLELVNTARGEIMALRARGRFFRTLHVKKRAGKCRSRSRHWMSVSRSRFTLRKDPVDDVGSGMRYAPMTLRSSRRRAILLPHAVGSS